MTVSIFFATTLLILLSAATASDGTTTHFIPYPSHQLAKTPIRGGGRAPYTKKIFTPAGCLRDHLTIMLQIPRILSAYVGPFAVNPKTNEAIMLAVNSKNQCPWCTTLHGELGRMAGLGDKVQVINSAATLDDIRKASDEAAVTYARIFAENDGRGEKVAVAFADLKIKMGAQKSASVNALCWFLHWGSTCGNTIGAFLKGRLVGRPKCGSSWLSIDPLYEFVFFLYYGVCYMLVTTTTLLLKIFPAEVPGIVNSLLGVVLLCVASIWIVPLGVLGIITVPFRISRSKDAPSCY